VTVLRSSEASEKESGIAVGSEEVPRSLPPPFDEDERNAAHANVHTHRPFRIRDVVRMFSRQRERL